MPLAGKSLMPREIAAACFEDTPWRTYELTKAIATCLGESAGYIGAYHDNEGSDGSITSRDCGLFQINIQERFVGTQRESDLRTESKDPAEYEPVIVNNVKAALNLYDDSWRRGGQPDIRRWQPWVAYTTGWATFGEAWVWKQENGRPVGPWTATGRYIHRAIAGQMNYHVVIAKDWNAQKALKWAKEYAEEFGVHGATYSLSSGVVAITYAKAPAAPPANGVGPRPVPNDGV